MNQGRRADNHAFELGGHLANSVPELPRLIRDGGLC
jgi:hypothetical protein